MNRDLNIGICLSLGVHSLVLFGFSPRFQGAQIGLPIGDGSVEVNLVAAGPGKDGLVAPKSKSRPVLVAGKVATPNPAPSVVPSKQEEISKVEDAKTIEESPVQGNVGEMSSKMQLADVDAGNLQGSISFAGAVGSSDGISALSAGDGDMSVHIEGVSTSGEGGGGKDKETLSTGGSDGVAAPIYARNPKPDYPMAAQRAGSEGRVLVRVVVSETGAASSLSIEKSSGYRILDLAAERAVMKWKFIPASRGRTNISSVCVVPIRFNLQEGVQIE